MLKNLILSCVALIAAAQEPAKNAYAPEDSYLRWRLLPSEQVYQSIDDDRLKQYVEELTAITAIRSSGGGSPVPRRTLRTPNGCWTSSARSASPTSASNRTICRRSGCPHHGV